MKMYDPLDYRLSELSKLEPKKGRVLISDPFLPDPYFKRSVVLLVEHNDKGSLGFILNKPLEMSLSDTELKVDAPGFTMHFGGPVQSTDLFYLHSIEPELEGSTEIKDGFFWGGDFKIIESMIQDGTVSKDDIRFFVGYSGWEADQLIKEIKEDSWLVHETELKNLFKMGSENLWKKILSELDSELAILSTFPEDPNMN